ncbi:FkbM family methyltransferase [Actinoalloteichus hymeniacidonis]|uniref:Methyltransferase, FkbM family n=1 Tax=Actinoalloteichus hymeniacidonis TaxID=340345 RepID=A0AAC9HNE4_9PSEU|nr:FkbM family methyltransferase [Actinoalloteichus hymeniacidonis]AOS62485.1 methyltransferase, FkbM family [Actinoalloteichus hymeniacidonis]MBB5909484.1 FkbM family methyltransferase [Actinoalloteichus hymeniacidonis]
MSDPAPRLRPVPPLPEHAKAFVNGRTKNLVNVLRWLAVRTSFVEKEILGLDTVVRPGDTCIDIGAEYGLYTYQLLKLVGAQGAVHTVEPQPSLVKALRLAMRALGASNVHVHSTAVGSASGSGVLSLPRRNGLPVHGRAFLTTGAKNEGPNAEFASRKPLRVPVITLDELCDREGLKEVHFIKADVEGAELTLLEGATKILKEQRPALLLEIEDRHLAKFEHRAEDLVGRLAELDYVPYVWQDGWRKVERVTEVYRNYLFTARPLKAA